MVRRSMRRKPGNDCQLKQNYGDGSSSTDSESTQTLTPSEVAETKAMEVKLRQILEEDSEADTSEDESVSGIQFVLDTQGGDVDDCSNRHLIRQLHNDTESDSSDDAVDDEEMTVSMKGKQIKRKRDKRKTDGKGLELASSLHHGLDLDNLTYFGSALSGKTELKTYKLQLLSVESGKQQELLKKSVLKSDFEKQSEVIPYEEGLRQGKRLRKAERDKTKGRGWFDMPATEMTDEKRNDLMVLKMRRVLDPKRFYKAPDMKSLPKYFQMGRVVETHAEYYNSRVPKKQRKHTLVDELLADAQFRQYNKRKYQELQARQHGPRGAHKQAKRWKKKKK